MKETRSVLNSLVACGVALAMVSTLAAQSGDQSAAKVVRLKGAVRSSTGNNVWQPLKVGHITGSVKKMSAASKYEVKLPNGVAGIKGTVYECFAEGVIKVREGSMVAAYTGSAGSIVTQVIMSMQMFD